MTAIALSVRQPWAWAIIAGLKDIENRTWTTRYRGLLLIHAGQRIDWEGFATLDRLGLELPDPDRLERGGIIGRVQLVEIIKAAEGPWALDGCWHWRLTKPEPKPFQPIRGQLGLWKPRL
jgi:hypothetical protein